MEMEDPFGDDEVAKQYMLDAINEDTRANTTQPITEEDDDFAPPPNQQQHVLVRILKLYAWCLQ